MVPFSKARAGFFYYNLLIYSQEIEECSPIFSPFSPFFLVGGGEGEVVGKIVLLLGTKASEFHSFFEDEKASRNLICRRSVNSDGGGFIV